MGVIITGTSEPRENKKKLTLKDLKSGDVFKYVGCPEWEDCFRMLTGENKYVRLNGRSPGELVDSSYSTNKEVQLYDLYSRSEKVNPYP